MTNLLKKMNTSQCGRQFQKVLTRPMSLIIRTKLMMAVMLSMLTKRRNFQAFNTSSTSRYARRTWVKLIKTVPSMALRARRVSGART